MSREACRRCSRDQRLDPPRRGGTAFTPSTETIYSKPVMTRNTGAQILANPATSAGRLTLRRAGKPVIVKVDPATP
jgi:hypothetical protein